MSDAIIEFLKSELKGHRDQSQQALDQAIHEVKTVGTVAGQTADELKKVSASMADVQARLQEVEQKAAARGTAPESKAALSIGDMVAQSDEFKSACARNAREMGAVDVGSFHKTAIVNASGQNQPLVPAQRLPGILAPATRRLTIRDLIPVAATGSNLIEYAKEDVFTNNAAPQYSSPNRENVAKAESGITFTLATTPIITLAHWIPASRQVLSDAAQLAGYINNRLTYGLKLEEEDEILNGLGTGGALNGLYNQATAYNRGASGDQQLDTLLKALLQVTLSEYAADAIVLNPIDWANIQLLKDADGKYLFADPHGVAAPSVWGQPVVATNSMTSGNFLAGAFGIGCQLWDREQATVRVAEQHSDFFVKNMVAILAEERIGLTMYRPTAFVKGTF
jgi:HK97 family phage major capsid protein